MKIVIAGGHGKIARLLGALAAARGEEVVGLVRNPDHLDDLRSDGFVGRVRDLETSTAAELAEDLAGADAVVFAAGAGPGSGAPRKDSVDRGAAALLADAATTAGVGAYLLISSIGVDRVRDGRTPEGVDEVFVAYLRAKLAAEQDLLSRNGLHRAILRPAALTDDPGTSRVQLAAGVDSGSVPRADVAAVALAMLDRLVQEWRDLPVVGLTSGDVPVTEAVAALS